VSDQAVDRDDETRDLGLIRLDIADEQGQVAETPR
jgi:hypothetical protein